MIPDDDKIWSTIRGKLSNTNLYFMPNEFLNWMKYRHYPIVTWTLIFEDPPYGKLEQYFNTTNYGKWSLLIRLTKQIVLPACLNVWLTPQEPSAKVTYDEQDGWILVDIQQAGKYVS